MRKMTRNVIWHMALAMCQTLIEEWRQKSPEERKLQISLAEAIIRNEALGFISDDSYRTHRYGMVGSFSGCALIDLDGVKLEFRGYCPKGTPETLTSQGGIHLIYE